MSREDVEEYNRIQIEFGLSSTRMIREIIRLRDMEARSNAILSSVAEMKRLRSVGDTVGEWQDREAFLAWNKSVSAAHLAVCHSVDALFGSGFSNTMFWNATDACDAQAALQEPKSGIS